MADCVVGEWPCGGVILISCCVILMTTMISTFLLRSRESKSADANRIRATLAQFKPKIYFNKDWSDVFKQATWVAIGFEFVQMSSFCFVESFKWGARPITLWLPFAGSNVDFGLLDGFDPRHALYYAVLIPASCVLLLGVVAHKWHWLRWHAGTILTLHSCDARLACGSHSDESRAAQDMNAVGGGAARGTRRQLHNSVCCVPENSDAEDGVSDKQSCCWCFCFGMRFEERDSKAQPETDSNLSGTWRCVFSGRRKARSDSGESEDPEPGQPTTARMPRMTSRGTSGTGRQRSETEFEGFEPWCCNCVKKLRYLEVNVAKVFEGGEAVLCLVLYKVLFIFITKTCFSTVDCRRSVDGNSYVEASCAEWRTNSTLPPSAPGLCLVKTGEVARVWYYYPPPEEACPDFYVLSADGAYCEYTVYFGFLFIFGFLSAGLFTLALVSRWRDDLASSHAMDAATKMTRVQYNEMRTAFQEMDYNKDGSISRQEVFAALQTRPESFAQLTRLGMRERRGDSERASVKAERIFNDWDVDADGDVELDDFRRWWESKLFEGATGHISSHQQQVCLLHAFSFCFLQALTLFFTPAIHRLCAIMGLPIERVLYLFLLIQFAVFTFFFLVQHSLIVEDDALDEQAMLHERRRSRVTCCRPSRCSISHNLRLALFSLFAALVSLSLLLLGDDLSICLVVGTFCACVAVFLALRTRHSGGHATVKEQEEEVVLNRKFEQAASVAFLLALYLLLLCLLGKRGRYLALSLVLFVSATFVGLGTCTTRPIDNVSSERPAASCSSFKIRWEAVALGVMCLSIHFFGGDSRASSTIAVADRGTRLRLGAKLSNETVVGFLQRQSVTLDGRATQLSNLTQIDESGCFRIRDNNNAWSSAVPSQDRVNVCEWADEPILATPVFTAETAHNFCWSFAHSFDAATAVFTLVIYVYATLHHAIIIDRNQFLGTSGMYSLLVVTAKLVLCCFTTVFSTEQFTGLCLAVLLIFNFLLLAFNLYAQPVMDVTDQGILANNVRSSVYAGSLLTAICASWSREKNDTSDPVVVVVWLLLLLPCCWLAYTLNNRIAMSKVHGRTELVFKDAEKLLEEKQGQPVSPAELGGLFRELLDVGKSNSLVKVAFYKIKRWNGSCVPFIELSLEFMKDRDILICFHNIQKRMWKLMHDKDSLANLGCVVRTLYTFRSVPAFNRIVKHTDLVVEVLNTNHSDSMVQTGNSVMIGSDESISKELTLTGEEVRLLGEMMSRHWVQHGNDYVLSWKLDPTNKSFTRLGVSNCKLPEKNEDGSFSQLLQDLGIDCSSAQIGRHLFHNTDARGEEVWGEAMPDSEAKIDAAIILAHSLRHNLQISTVDISKLGLDVEQSSKIGRSMSLSGRRRSSVGGSSSNRLWGDEPIHPLFAIGYTLGKLLLFMRPQRRYGDDNGEIHLERGIESSESNPCLSTKPFVQNCLALTFKDVRQAMKSIDCVVCEFSSPFSSLTDMIWPAGHAGAVAMLAGALSSCETVNSLRVETQQLDDVSKAVLGEALLGITKPAFFFHTGFKHPQRQTEYCLNVTKRGEFSESNLDEVWWLQCSDKRWYLRNRKDDDATSKGFIKAAVEFAKRPSSDSEIDSEIQVRIVAVDPREHSAFSKSAFVQHSFSSVVRLATVAEPREHFEVFNPAVPKERVQKHAAWVVTTRVFSERDIGRQFVAIKGHPSADDCLLLDGESSFNVTLEGSVEHLQSPLEIKEILMGNFQSREKLRLVANNSTFECMNQLKHFLVEWEDAPERPGRYIIQSVEEHCGGKVVIKEDGGSKRSGVYIFSNCKDDKIVPSLNLHQLSVCLDDKSRWAFNSGDKKFNWGKDIELGKGDAYLLAAALRSRSCSIISLDLNVASFDPAGLAAIGNALLDRDERGASTFSSMHVGKKPQSIERITFVAPGRLHIVWSDETRASDTIEIEWLPASSECKPTDGTTLHLSFVQAQVGGIVTVENENNDQWHFKNPLRDCDFVQHIRADFPHTLKSESALRFSSVEQDQTQCRWITGTSRDFKPSEATLLAGVLKHNTCVDTLILDGGFAFSVGDNVEMFEDEDFNRTRIQRTKPAVENNESSSSSQEHGQLSYRFHCRTKIASDVTSELYEYRQEEWPHANNRVTALIEDINPLDETATVLEKTVRNPIQNCCGPLGATAISQMLRYNTTITTLQISGNAIGPTGAQRLGAVLQHANCSIKTLDVSQNELKVEGMLEILTAAQSFHTSISNLSISNNHGHGPNVGTCIAGMLEHNTNLTYLDASSNDVQLEGANMIMSAIENRKTSLSLKIKMTKEREETEKSLMDLSDLEEEELHWSDKGLCCVDFLVLAGALRSEKGASLERINLKNNRMAPPFSDREPLFSGDNARDKVYFSEGMVSTRNNGPPFHVGFDEYVSGNPPPVGECWTVTRVAEDRVTKDKRVGGVRDRAIVTCTDNPNARGEHKNEWSFYNPFSAPLINSGGLCTAAAALAGSLGYCGNLKKLQLWGNCMGYSAGCLFAEAIRSHHNKVEIACQSLRDDKEGDKEKVDMSKQNLDAGDGAILGAMLQYNTEVVHLILRDNYLGEDGAKEIFVAFQNNTELDTVDLSQNRIGDHGRGETTGGTDDDKSLTAVLQESLNKNLAGGGLVKLNLAGNFPFVFGSEGGLLKGLTKIKMNMNNRSDQGEFQLILDEEGR